MFMMEDGTLSMTEPKAARMHIVARGSRVTWTGVKPSSVFILGVPSLASKLGARDSAWPVLLAEEEEVVEEVEE